MLLVISRYSIFITAFLLLGWLVRSPTDFASKGPKMMHLVGGQPTGLSAFLLGFEFFTHHLSLSDKNFSLCEELGQGPND